MTPEQIAKAREIIDAATPGPWRWRVFGNEQALYADHGPRHIMVSGGYTTNEMGILNPMKEGQPVSDFIAAARTGWPEALDENERLQAILKKQIEFKTAHEIDGAIGCHNHLIRLEKKCEEQRDKYNYDTTKLCKIIEKLRAVADAAKLCRSSRTVVGEELAQQALTLALRALEQK